MRLCFIVEARYRSDVMPLAVADRLRAWGHDIEVFEPDGMLSPVSELVSRRSSVDAFVLKTVSGGPGLTLLDAARSAGHVTVNEPRAIRLARDKAVAASLCRTHEVPFPLTYFVTHPDLLTQVPAEVFPIVVKPADGSSNEGVRLYRDAGELAADPPRVGAGRYLLAQPYAENPGRDLKLYCAGEEVFATEQPSVLHPGRGVVPRLVDLDPALRRLARTVGKVFGLHVYGLDVVESPQGWVVVDVNDFPSFTTVPDAAGIVGEAILRVAARRSPSPLRRALRRSAAAVGQRPAVAVGR